MLISVRNNDQPRVFFAHSTHSFGTDMEARIVQFLGKQFSVICPNRDIGRLKNWKGFLQIIGWADAIVVLEHDGFITMALYAQLLSALKQGIPVWCIRSLPEGFAFFQVERIEYQPNRTNRNYYGKLNLNLNASPVLPSIH